jgi:hypothetical protein
MLPEKRMFGQHLGNIIFRFLLLHGTRLSAQINTCHLHTKRLENLFFKPLLYFSPFPLNFCGQCNKSAVVRYRPVLARILPITYQRKDSPAHFFRAIGRILCQSFLTAHSASIAQSLCLSVIGDKGFVLAGEAPAKPSPQCIIRSAQLAPLRFSLSSLRESPCAVRTPLPLHRLDNSAFNGMRSAP